MPKKIFKNHDSHDQTHFWAKAPISSTSWTPFRRAPPTRSRRRRPSRRLWHSGRRRRGRRVARSTGSQFLNASSFFQQPPGVGLYTIFLEGLSGAAFPSKFSTSRVCWGGLLAFFLVGIPTNGRFSLWCLFKAAQKGNPSKQDRTKRKTHN